MMLGKMADYIERIKLIIGAEPFFAPPNDEQNRRAMFPTRDEIILKRTESDMEKRKREEDSDESFLPPAAVRSVAQADLMTSDTSTENVPEHLVAPGNFAIPSAVIRRHRSRQRASTISVSSLPAATVIMQPTSVITRPEPVPIISPIPAPRVPTKQEEALKEMISGSIINTANQARLDAIEENSKSFQKLLVEQTKKHIELKKEAISQAEDQHRRDQTSLKEARQTRKVASR